MFGKKEFGVKCETEISDMRFPRDDSVLEVEWRWDSRTASSEENGFCFVNIDLKFPFGEIAKQHGRSMSESVDCGVRSPRLREWRCHRHIAPIVCEGGEACRKYRV